MKPRVLALDFDGTIAEHDAINADTAAAIREARGAGLLTVLVTGRILSDLDALFRDPPPFDAIVAENGAVLRLPHLPSPITLSQRPDPRFLAELSRRGIQHQVVFTLKGRPTGRRARTVRDLLAALPALDDDVVQGHLRCGDFRRWIEDVFGDRELGAAILDLERENVADARDALGASSQSGMSARPT